ncbi:restriction endonuclease subunit S [Chlorobium sp. N1]|uniref:restriction endonuclease subunit S n=1 Tax=Chlorobium sp. N1 TaxID=2491138 RepID=UPI00103CAA51|nr:restriction endonuclease subunit S [Chlorobium sp. N1]TCD46946.1 restriction endonuclease subunit S [Chlorobium sp. N1]
MQGCQDSTGKWIKVEFHEIATLSKKKFNPQKQTMDEPCIELEHIEKETGRLLGTISSAGQLSTKNTFRIGDVLFGKLRPNLRKYINCDFSGVCSSEIWVLNAQKQTYSSFLFYLIQQEKFIRSACITSGSKMPRADWSVVSEVPFPLPPLPEQKAIADLLFTWDEAIKKTERLIHAKERSLNAYGRDLFDRRNDGNYDGWKVLKLKSVLTEHGDKSTGLEEVYSVSVHKGLINQVEHLGRSFSAANTDNYNRVHFGDIVYTKSPTGDFPLGIVKQSYTENDVIVSPLYGVFTPKTFNLGIVLDFYFSSSMRARNYLFPIVQKGAKNTIAITNKTFLSNTLHLPVDEQAQKEVAEFVFAAREEIGLLKQLAEQYKTQKRGLMQKMLTGEWRVKSEIINQYMEA